MLNEIMRDTSASLEKAELTPYLTRSWIHSDRVLVHDFDVNGVRFAFDVLPLPKERYELSLVTRKDNQNYQFDGFFIGDKMMVDVCSAEALKTRLNDKARELVADIERNVPRPSDASKVQSTSVKLAFQSNSDVWTVVEKNGAITLKADNDGSEMGNLVWCDLPYELLPNVRYELKLDWHLRSGQTVVKPCVRAPRLNINRVIDNVALKGSDAQTADQTSLHSIAFTVPKKGFSQFVLGASSFTGRDAGAVIKSMTLIRHPMTEKPLKPQEVESYAAKVQHLTLKDGERYSKAFSAGDATARARARLMFQAHAVEKGLSHMEFRAGFGRRPIWLLAKDVGAWLKSGRPAEDYFFKSALSVMRAYFDRHEKIGFDVSGFKSLFSDRALELIASADPWFGGAVTASESRETVPNINPEKTFMDVAFGRRSVREFTDEPVTDSDIFTAVQIASQAPSVCNRQGPRVHHFKDPGQISTLVNLQGGFNGYKKPPTLLLVSCDLTAFTSPKERNQGFVDGGLFLMLLLLGLEQIGLGACPLNSTMDLGREAKVRKIAKIPETEAFVSWIAVGHYDKDVLIPRSVRYPTEHLISTHPVKQTSS